MRSLADLLHPITPEVFARDHLHQEPLHIRAPDNGRGRDLLDWEGFNAMLSRAASFTHQTLRLVREGEPVPPEAYCSPARTPTGLVQRPSPAKIQVLLATGASLVVNEIQTMTPSIAALAQDLGRAFGAAVGVNAYCSFPGVQAFGPHFDLHDVFAVQVEGEKTWRIYEGRADAPVAYPEGTEQEVRGWFEATRGALRQEIRMRPGDVLYLPRGWYHDALARTEPSLHLTCSVSGQTGRAVFDLLEKAAMQQSAFRAYLPPAHLHDGAALAAHLRRLGEQLATLAALPEFHAEIAMAQERLILRPAAYGLPDRVRLTQYRPTGLAFAASSRPVQIALDWAFAQPRFALELLIAEFDFVDPDALAAAVAEAEAAGALARV